MRKHSIQHILTVGAAIALVAAVFAFEPAPAAAEHHGHEGHGFVGGPRFHAFFGFSPFFYRPFYYDPFYFGYGYGYPPYRGYEGGIDRNIARLNGWGAIDVNVKPRKAEVWVDGKYVGTAADFDGFPAYLWLKEGVHQVTVYRGGFESYQREIDITPGLVINLKYKMVPGQSEPPGKR